MLACYAYEAQQLAKSAGCFGAYGPISQTLRVVLYPLRNQIIDIRDPLVNPMTHHQSSSIPVLCLSPQLTCDHELCDVHCQ
jgi:hypothetical protein